MELKKPKRGPAPRVKNLSKVRETRRKARLRWEANHPEEYRKLMLRNKLNYDHNHPEKAKRIARRVQWRSSGMDPDAVEALLASATACEICGSTKRLVPDHNHETRALRGALCSLCNKALGAFKDNPTLLRSAATYLEKYIT